MQIHFGGIVVRMVRVRRGGVGYELSYERERSTSVGYWASLKKLQKRLATGTNIQRSLSLLIDSYDIACIGPYCSAPSCCWQRDAGLREQLFKSRIPGVIQGSAE